MCGSFWDGYMGVFVFVCVCGYFSICVFILVCNIFFLDSDYGYERYGESKCVLVFWYNLVFSLKDCSFG